MDQRVNTGLLIAVAALTAVNTIMIGVGGTGGSSSPSTDGGNEEKKSNITATKRDRDQGKNKNPRNRNMNQQRQKQNKKPQNPPTTIEFQKSKHDFGQVKAGSKVTKKFSFKNTGDNPYVIQNAKGSCGCTVPQYPKKPIQPGETGKITVNYNPGRKVTGVQNNSVTLTGNTEPRKTKLRIKANVQKSG
jgi:hypothetical protein